MKKQMILWTCMLLLVLVGCKKDDVQYTDRYELKGKVEKGPFVRGSEVTVYELSERLERTGIIIRRPYRTIREISISVFWISGLLM